MRPTGSTNCQSPASSENSARLMAENESLPVKLMFSWAPSTLALSDSTRGGDRVVNARFRLLRLLLLIPADHHVLIHHARLICIHESGACLHRDVIYDRWNVLRQIEYLHFIQLLGGTGMHHHAPLQEPRCRRRHFG